MFNLKSFFLAVVLFFLISPLFCLNQLIANSEKEELRLASPVTSSRQQDEYEVWHIDFFGNTYFSSSELLDYLFSTSSSLSFPHKVLKTLYDQSKKNGSISKYLIEQIKNATKPFEKEYQYFSQKNAKIDCETIKSLYNSHGFHFADVDFIFGFDSIGKKNILVFNINENNRYTISDLKYLGLEEVDTDTEARVSRVQNIKMGDYYNESKIESEVTSISSSLLNSGYMYSKILWNDFYPNVVMDTESNTDSITCIWDIGQKIKFGNIIFEDSTNGQKIVANSTKKKMILFKEGDYYAKWRIERSVENLLSMGTFESVSIDTLKREYSTNENVRDFVIKTNYRKLKDWDIGFFVDQTQIDNLFNAGFSGSIRHHNLFGSAQSARLFFDFSLKDLSYFLSALKFPDYQFKIGSTYSQPLLWMLNNTRIGLSTGLIFSLETVSDLFKVYTVSFPLKFPVKLSRSTYFTSMQIELNFDREEPLNFHSTMNSALEKARTKQDTNNILQTFTFYNNINNYLREPDTHIFTSNILSLFLVADSRNHPFSPTNGSYVYLSFDGLNIFLSHPAIAGSAKYFRTQILHNRYWQVSKVLVAAMKAKLGMTYLMNEANAFVPLDRQFFAGGANSIRAWPARTLRYYIPSEDFTNSDNNLQDFAINYIGSKTLIEGSFELRRKLSDILPGANENFQWLMDDLGVSFFVDFGNAFGWYREDGASKNTSTDFINYFTKLAVGTGFGFHYETPVGPVRVDFSVPVHDPMHIKKPFSELSVHFGIGHAF